MDISIKRDLSDTVKVWCWTGKTTRYGTFDVMRTSCCENLYDLAKRVWLDKWIPFGDVMWIKGDGRNRTVIKGSLKDTEDNLLIACENALRAKYKTRPVPSGRFMEFGELPDNLVHPNSEKIQGLEPSKEFEALDVVDGVVIGTKKMKVDEAWIKNKMQDGGF